MSDAPFDRVVLVTDTRRKPDINLDGLTLARYRA
ncbi:hypothetical protein BN2476_430054 [Paraburkholderia piptadeniae]|uniref:Uncharacterized protein n=1 Tax=Paraburkholderia piptadeniae TaxID=1701573 RepID=A0A1N7SBN6_9BURK|nr:hypothetical protein BN2476_430054 [Paraburkholderia piptadeniae]